MQQSKRSNVLFYSKYCIHSTHLSQYLDKHPNLKEMFIPVCVDTKVKIPYFIKAVPTIVFYDNMGQMDWRSGAEVFNWFKQFIVEHNQTTQQQGISDYDSGLMGGEGTAFTFLENEGGGDDNIIGDFAWLTNPEATQITITNDSETEAKRFGPVVKTSESALQRYKDERDKGMPMPSGQRPPGLEEIDFTNTQRHNTQNQFNNNQNTPSMSISYQNQNQSPMYNQNIPIGPSQGGMGPRGGMSSGISGMGGGMSGMSGMGGGMSGMSEMGGGMAYNPDPNVPVGGGGMGGGPQPQQLPSINRPRIFPGNPPNQSQNGFGRQSHQQSFGRFKR